MRRIYLCLLGAAMAVAAQPAWSQQPMAVSSPDGTIRAEIMANGGSLQYRVLVDGKELLEPSDLGLVTSELDLKQDVVLGTRQDRKIDETYPFRGEKSVAVNRANECTIEATCQGKPLSIDVHVADDGVGLRCRLPARPKQLVRKDHSAWKLAGNPTLWAQPEIGCYEGTFGTTTLHDLKTGKPYGMPLAGQSGNLYFLITEAALKDYGDLGLQPTSDHLLQGFLCADPKGWTTDDAILQPWRVTIIARNLNQLVNTTLVQNLNPPPEPELAKADWIKPGRCAWQWLAVGGPKQSEQNQWVDWTHELGFEYYLVDDGWNRWKTDDKDKWGVMADLCRYAATKHVKVWLWVDSKEVKTPQARQEYFQKAASIGIVGVKTDFPPATSRAWANWYYETARDAAASKLMVDFHGATKPTGMERTWPNEVNREGIRGHEWQMTRYKRVLDPHHETILPFTRLVIGHGDFTPTVFDPRELAGNSWSHELAQSILFSAPFLCLGGHPKTLLENPARDLIATLPTTWDETRVLPGTVPGVCAALARRKGRTWYVAAINSDKPTELDIPLDFLGQNCRGVLLEDGPTLNSYQRGEREFRPTDHLKLTLQPLGGLVAKFN